MTERHGLRLALRFRALAAGMARCLPCRALGRDPFLAGIEGDLVPGDLPAAALCLHGGFVVPRLADGHAHLLGLGQSLETVDLRDAGSFDEVVERVAREAPLDGFVLGFGWDQNVWSPPVLPHHAALSDVFPHRPVVLRRVDGHALVANREALRIAGVSSQTPEPPGGRILLDPAGRPTGVLLDNAMSLVEDRIPAPGPAERGRLLRSAMAEAVRSGLTAVHDMDMDPATVAAMKVLDAAGEVPLRVYAYGGSGALEAHRGRRFSVVGVKLYADGALGSRGAALLAPYSDDPGNRGLLLREPEELAREAASARQRGLQVAVHAIGDRGVRVALDVLGGGGDLPVRIEHAQVVHPGDFRRFASGGFVASMQPAHATSDMGWVEARLGPERIGGAYALRTMLDHGVPLVLGSDFPIESPDIRKGIYAAVTRMDEAGRPPGGWHPEQALTVSEALEGFSTAAAAVVGDAGPHADFTVFDRDLRACPPREILHARILLVVVDGEAVYADAAEEPP